MGDKEQQSKSIIKKLKLIRSGVQEIKEIKIETSSFCDLSINYNNIPKIFEKYTRSQPTP